MSWSESEKKSGSKVKLYSLEAKCISVSYAPLPLKEMCKREKTEKKRKNLSLQKGTDLGHFGVQCYVLFTP